ncbi:MAG: hypothetical protein HKP58_16500 [Desulfatitalea sp.]|nr:ParD-like family protein [Desulfatitalea sp.]NNK02014.1 hypothetical protein [Desulfatitalea sp.]
MAHPMRLSTELVEAAERAGRIQKRSVPKQIEYWAAIGKAMENVINYSDIFAVLQGFKKITIVNKGNYSWHQNPLPEWATRLLAENGQ